MNFGVLLSAFPFIAGGIWVTLKYSLVSLLCGLPLGTGLAMAKVSSCSWGRRLSDFYTALFRGTPLLVQFGLIYFATPQVTGYSISTFEAGVLAFSLNSAAYTSEIIRSGIESIEPGQWEACQVLGLTSFQAFWYVILPQAIRNILPALVNEIVNLLKESAIVSVFGEMDLYKRAQVVAAEKFLYFEPLLLSAFLYFILVSIFSWIGTYLEKKAKPC